MPSLYILLIAQFPMTWSDLQGDSLAAAVQVCILYGITMAIKSRLQVRFSPWFGLKMFPK